MPRAERELQEELVPHAEPSERSPEVVAPVPAAILRMQASAGNRATSELLARDAAKEKPKSAYAMSIPKVGDFPLQSLMLGNSDKDDIHVTLSLEDGAKFQGPGLTANYPTVTIKAGSVTITLTDVIISSYSISSGPVGEDAVVDIALNAQKREVK
jgi:hypothetical protein